MSDFYDEIFRDLPDAIAVIHCEVPEKRWEPYQDSRNKGSGRYHLPVEVKHIAFPNNNYSEWKRIGMGIEGIQEISWIENLKLSAGSEIVFALKNLEDIHNVRSMGSPSRRIGPSSIRPVLKRLSYSRVLFESC